MELDVHAPGIHGLLEGLCPGTAGDDLHLVPAGGEGAQHGPVRKPYAGPRRQLSQGRLGRGGGGAQVHVQLFRPEHVQHGLQGRPGELRRGDAPDHIRPFRHGPIIRQQLHPGLPGPFPDQSSPGGVVLYGVCGPDAAEVFFFQAQSQIIRGFPEADESDLHGKIPPDAHPA